MNNEEELRLKLRKIEALFAGAGTIGERDAAEAALGRNKEKVEQTTKTAPLVEYTFTFGDRWSKQLFMALCRRYALSPYRYNRQRHTTVMARAPKAFIDDVLWPEYVALSEALTEYLHQATEKIISEEIYKDTTEAEEIVVPLLET
jgi:hypothetical protein